MRTQAPVSLLVLASLALAGCSGGSDGTTDGTTGTPPLQEGRGGIDGLLIDDVYRPISGGLIFLQGVGLTATTDDLGQFRFTDLLPDSYVAVVSAVGHEASPVNIDVRAGDYTEADIEARRIFSQDGRTVTTQFSVFISCAVDFVVNGFVVDCTADQSGDSDRAQFVSDYRDYGENATYLVTEMLANKEGRYEVQVRSTGCTSGGGRYAVSQFEGIYTRIIMPFDNVSAQSAEASYGPNDPWTNKCKIQTILFADSQFREELQGAGAPVCCGAGVHFGIKAQFVATLFLGPPVEDVETYCVLSSTCETG